MTRSLVLICLLIISCSTVAKLDGIGWRQYQSENFSLLTDIAPEQAKERLLDLELFRAVVLRITNAKPRQDRVKTTIIIFDRMGDFRKVVNRGGVGGYFSPRLRGNRMVMPRELPRASDNFVLYHEYVHYLVRDGKTVYPAWYEEGLADMLGATYVENGRVIVGAASDMRIKRLDAGDVYVSLEKVVTRDDIWRWNRYLGSYFYSMAWAAVNYIHVAGLHDRPDYSRQIGAYLTAVNAGKTRLEAFTDAFGITPAQMEKDIMDFLLLKRRGVLAIPVQAFPHPNEITVSDVSTRDALYEIAYLMISSNPKEARSLLRGLVKANPEDKRAAIGVAVTYQMEEKFDIGIPMAREALDPNDYLTYIELADMLRGSCDQKEPPADCPARRTEAASLYRQVLALDPGNPEGQLGLATALSQLGEHLDEALLHMMQAYMLWPWSASMNYWLGHVYLQLAQKDKALEYLLRASRWNHDDRLGEMILKDLVEIDPAYGEKED